MSAADRLQQSVNELDVALTARQERDRQTIERLVAALKARTGIQTSYIRPPVPSKAFDWHADYGDGEPGAYGRTEAEAMLELLEQ